jgi:hypothetical protein
MRLNLDLHAGKNLLSMLVVLTFQTCQDTVIREFSHQEIRFINLGEQIQEIKDIEMTGFGDCF